LGGGRGSGGEAVVVGVGGFEGWEGFLPGYRQLPKEVLLAVGVEGFGD